MTVFKTFQLLVASDSAGQNIIANVGNVVMSARQIVSSSLNTYFGYDTPPSSLAPYVEDPYTLGNAVTDGRFTAEETSSYFNITAPYTLYRETTQYAGNYFVLSGNSSGFYAISGAIGSGGTASLWSIYDNNGVLLKYPTNGQIYGFPCSNAVGFTNLLGDIDSNGTLKPTSLYRINITADTPRDRNHIQITSSTMDIDFLYWFNSLSRSSGQNDDPFTPGGTSIGNDTDPGQAGGGGNFTITGDVIPFPDMPTIAAVDAGFITLIKPTQINLNDLANYIWNVDPSTWNYWKRFLIDPMDYILSLSIFPVDPPATNTGYVTLAGLTTTVNAPILDSQYMDVNCGVLQLEEYWGAFLDYAPYTDVQIFLPYIGVRKLNTADVMGKTIMIRYRVDLLSGLCVAMISCGGTLLYSFSGQCSINVPLNNISMSNMVSAAVGMTTNLFGIAGAAMGENYGGLASSVGGVVTSFTGLHPNVEPRTGNIASSAGLLTHQKPYLIVTRPRQCLPNRQNEFIGYPSFVTVLLGSCSGFTRVYDIHLEGIDGTEAEANEIVSLLKGGVIF